MRTIQSRNNILVQCTEDKAQCVLVNSLYYHAPWMKRVPDSMVAELADVIEITIDEYDELMETIERDEEIIIDPTEPDIQPEPEEMDDSVYEATLEYLKQVKISEMSKTNKLVIYRGFDITLSDGNTYHFSLTDDDQRNLEGLARLLDNGETVLPYHADDELCLFYSVEDMTAITKKATAVVTYYNTYFNSLKMYIKAIDSIEVVSSIYYGIEIPEEYQSIVLKSLPIITEDANEE